MVTIMAVSAQIEKKRLVKKLKAARDRKSLQQGKRIEGRKSYRELSPNSCAKQSGFATETGSNIFRCEGFRKSFQSWVTSPIQEGRSRLVRYSAFWVRFE